MKRRGFLHGLSGLAGGAVLASCSSDKKTAIPRHVDDANAPAWLKGRTVGEWFAIPGTVHAGSPAAPTDDPTDPYCLSNRRLSYSGMALNDAELILAACGGHGDYSGNEVTSLDLSVDAPVWQLRSAATPMEQRTPDMAYYTDGKPSARHTYWSHHYSAKRKRVMLHRSRFVYGSGVSFPASNGFDLGGNRWDEAGTWSDGKDAACQDADGNVWSPSGFELWKWTAATDTWALAMTSATSFYNPMCFDTKRGHLFTLAWGDGQADGADVTAYIVTDDGTVRTPITFASGHGLSQLASDKPAYAGMEYDPGIDAYLFYEGSLGTGRVYVITPNETTTWNLDVYALGAASVVPPAMSVTCSRFRYVTSLGGFVLVALGSQNVLFLPTS